MPSGKGGSGAFARRAHGLQQGARVRGGRRERERTSCGVPHVQSSSPAASRRLQRVCSVEATVGFRKYNWFFALSSSTPPPPRNFASRPKGYPSCARPRLQASHVTQAAPAAVAAPSRRTATATRGGRVAGRCQPALRARGLCVAAGAAATAPARVNVRSLRGDVRRRRRRPTRAALPAHGAAAHDVRLARPRGALPPRPGLHDVPPAG